MAYHRQHTRGFTVYINTGYGIDIEAMCPVCGVRVTLEDAPNPPGVDKTVCPQCKTTLYLSLTLTIEWSERIPPNGHS